MNPSETEQNSILELIQGANKILVTYFSATDGDSLGAMLAIAGMLKKLGKEVTTFLSDEIPQTLSFLPNLDMVATSLDQKGSLVITLKCQDGQMDSVKYLIDDGKVKIFVTPKPGANILPESISFNEAAESTFDLIISVDSGDKKQAKLNYERYKNIFDETPLINIDHHKSNLMYGNINCVDFSASSTTQIIFRLFKSWDLTRPLIDADIATFLLTGLIWDTGSFKHSNTTPEALEAAAELVELGARQQDIVRNLFKTKKMSQLKLWGEILSRATTDKDNRLLWSFVTAEDYERTGSTEDDIGDIIDELLSNAPDIDFIFLFKEKPDGSVRASVRSTSDEKDCTKIVESFGGGGHRRAAGCGIAGISLQEAIQRILDKAREIQK